MGCRLDGSSAPGKQLSPSPGFLVTRRSAENRPPRFDVRFRSVPGIACGGLGDGLIGGPALVLDLPLECRAVREFAGHHVLPIEVTPKRRVIAVALAIIAAVAVTACASQASSTGTGIQAAQVSPAVAKLVAEVTDIPFAASDGNWAAAPIFQASTLDGPALTEGGRPEVLYVSTEYCPYCATEDWALLIALGRFGTFTGVNEIRSAIYPPIPPIDTWTFYRSSYTSNYLAFVPVETYSNVLVNPTASPLRATSYRVLQKLTPAERAVFDKIDKQHVTPLTDLGGKTELLGSPFSPTRLST